MSLFQRTTAWQCHSWSTDPHHIPGLPDSSALARCVPPGPEPVREHLVILLNFEVTRDDSFARNKFKVLPEVVTPQFRLSLS